MRVGPVIDPCGTPFSSFEGFLCQNYNHYSIFLQYLFSKAIKKCIKKTLYKSYLKNQSGQFIYSIFCLN